MGDKIFGYFLLFFGIAIIGFSAFQVFNIFTKRSEPIELFTFSGVSLNTDQVLTESLPEEFSQLLKEQPSKNTEVLSADMLNRPLNIFAYVVFMGFMSSIGFKIAQIGAIMVRPSKVELKEKTLKQVADTIKTFSNNTKGSPGKPENTSQ